MSNKILKIIELDIKKKYTLNEINKLLDENSVEFQNIDCVNWHEYPDIPKVEFRLVYCKSTIHIQFRVKEKSIIAQCKRGQENVFPSNDTCVEFFLATTPEIPEYFNFEFNCIGYCLVQRGTGRQNRYRYSQEKIHNIYVETSLGNETFSEKNGNFEWQLYAEIPLQIFDNENFDSLKNKILPANFYKCADKLTNKHYLTWNKINTPKPDFHRPEFFGKLQFV